MHATELIVCLNFEVNNVKYLLSLKVASSDK